MPPLVTPADAGRYRSEMAAAEFDAGTPSRLRLARGSAAPVLARPSAYLAA